ncbi:CRISPR-associated protein Csm4 [Pilibacter termitis]|uniref:CRISPR system Cms protein Csm4 n=1 Tax=Pilibacter termitis TaxID=263852 RepID=A0A1T4ND91_9ENTE|nr:type III-A CRISPR-associated RAMP protein Csm4 [Pilibacter termitis]SJZ77083.1 CRISPR-associated protein Csm4 [Pilibacter termitis]
MNLKIYKMQFHNAHFGNGVLSESETTFTSNRLFSALILESKKMGKLEEFLALADREDFVLSDAFPYKGEPFLPKPIGFPDFEDEEKDLEARRKNAKTAKKLKYIPFSLFHEYLNGTDRLEDFVEKQSELFEVVEQTKKGVDPYQVGVSYFGDTQLYFLAPKHELFQELMKSLQYSGLGGKRKSGFGSFELSCEEVSEEFSAILSSKKGGKFVALGNFYPENLTDELLTGAKYLLEKHSGFAFSTEVKETYRKQDAFTFKSGSVFSQDVAGKILDVRPSDFPHAVYHFAKPVWLNLEVSER